MKNTLKILSLVFVSLFMNVNAQDEITNRQQFQNVENIEKSYINKPLKEFLKGLKLEIKSVSYIREDESGPNRIILRFDDRETYAKLGQENIVPARITVYFINDMATKSIFNKLNQYGTIEENPIEQFKELKIQKLLGSNNHKMKF
ncbi:MAG: hypothetical protein QM564_03560 [Bergeyella sp.]